MSLKRVSVLAGAAALLVGMAAPAGALPVFTELPLLPGTFNGYAADLNKEVTAVGSANQGSGGSKAVKWDEAGAVTELPALPGATDSVAWGINEGGTAVGISGGAAVRWDTNGTVTALGGLPGYERSWANDINDSGLSAGAAFDPKSGEIRAVRWSFTSGAEELPRLDANDSSEAHDVNSAGIIVGRSGSNAVRWGTNGIPQALPGSSPADASEAHAINAGGTIVGIVWPSGAPGQAVRWDTAGSSYTSLQNLSGGTYSVANAISPDGVIVGMANTVVAGRVEYHAVLWSQNGSVTDLGPLGGGNAMAVADSGYVAGTSASRPGRWNVL
jgi:probable HAF family extracellular repeat protein